MTHITRESWLSALADEVRPWYEEAGSPLPEKIRLSCGFSVSLKHLGVCFPADSSADGTIEIFIKPDQDDPMTVAGIVMHELVHAAVPAGSKHGPVFRKLALAVGLEGRMTQALPGEARKAALLPIVEALGPYPHSALQGPKKKEKGSQAGQYVNVTCPDCGYRACAHAESQEIERLRCPVDGEVLLTKKERS